MIRFNVAICAEGFAFVHEPCLLLKEEQHFQSCYESCLFCGIDNMAENDQNLNSGKSKWRCPQFSVEAVHATYEMISADLVLDVQASGEGTPPPFIWGPAYCPFAQL